MTIRRDLSVTAESRASRCVDELWSSARRSGGAPSELAQLCAWESQLAARAEGLALDDGDGKLFGAVLTCPPTQLVVGADAWSRKLQLAKHGATILGSGKARHAIFAGDFARLFAVTPEGAVLAKSRSRELPIELYAASLDEWLERYAVETWIASRELRAWSPPSGSGPRLSDEGAWAAVERRRGGVELGFENGAAVAAWKPHTRQGFVIETRTALDIRPLEDAPSGPLGGWAHPGAAHGKVLITERDGAVEQTVAVDGRVVEQLHIEATRITGTAWVALTTELDALLSATTAAALRRREARIDPRYRRSLEDLQVLLSESAIEANERALEVERNFAGLYLPASGFLVGIAAILEQHPATVPWPDRAPRVKGAPVCPIAAAPDQSFWIDREGVVHAYSYEVGRYRKVAPDFATFVAMMSS